MLAANLFMEYGTLTRRRSLAVHVLARCAAFLLTIAFMILARRYARDDSYLPRGLATFPFYLACLLLFEESLAQKTFLYFMDFSATTFLASLCIWLGSRLPLGERLDAGTSLLYASAILLLLPLYLKRVRPRVRRVLALFRSSDPLYAAFPFLSFVLFALLFGPINFPDSPRWLGIMLLYVLLVALTYHILFSHFSEVYDRLQAEAQLLRAERQLSLQKKYYEEVDRGLRTQAKLLHDERHHLVGLASLARAGDPEAVDRYVEELLGRCVPPGGARRCENAVLNAVIGGYVTMAEEKGIVVGADLELPEGIGIDEYELCAFFGNSLENAIEACERIPAGSPLRAGRFIDIGAWMEEGRLVVRVENSFEEEPGRKDLLSPSSKGSGIGLESLRAVVERYRGSMSCERRGDVFVLSAVLCLPG